MKIAKTLSTLSLAFALQAGALIAATVVLAPSDAVAAVSKKQAKKGGWKSGTVGSGAVGGGPVKPKPPRRP